MGKNEDNEKVCLNKSDRKWRRRRKNEFGLLNCEFRLNVFVCLVLLIFVVNLSSVKAQFPNDEIEAALEMPPSIVRPGNAQHRDHHRHRPEQK